MTKRLGWMLAIALVLLAAPVRASLLEDDDALAPEDAKALGRNAPNSSFEVRRDAIQTLAKARKYESAHALGAVVLQDRRVALRVLAAKGLATNPAEGVTDLILDTISRGGVNAVQQALTESLAKRPDAVERARHWFGGKRMPEQLSRILIVRAVGRVPTADAQAFLLDEARGDDLYTRPVAIRELATRKDGRLLLPGLIDAELRGWDDIDTRLACLDAMVDFDWHELEMLMDRIPAWEGPQTRRHLRYIEKRLEYFENLQDFKLKKGTRYAHKGETSDRAPRKPVFVDGRLDVVFAFDTTFSEDIREEKHRVLQAAAGLRASGVRFRIGVVAFRDKLRDQNQRNTSYTTHTLPLTADPERIEEFVSALYSDGVGQSNAAINAALRDGLARMDWHPEADRVMHLFASTGCDRKRRSYERARMHFEQDQLPLHVWHIRGDVKDLEKLAKAGGTVLEPARMFRIR